jgi:homopolymeric O-antigen transport system permease protein
MTSETPELSVQQIEAIRHERDVQQARRESTSSTPDPTHAHDARGETWEPRPTTIIRAPKFSVAVLATAMSELIEYRDLLYTLSIHRLKVRYKQSVLGPAWAVLQPVLLMLLFTVVFSRIVRLPSEGVPYALFAYSALLPWTYFSNSLSSATNSLVSHFNLVTKVYFPREILPLTYVIAGLIDFLVASVVLGGLLVYYHVTLTVHAFIAIPTIAVLTVFTVAASFVLSAIQVRYRDVGVAMPLIMQLWMFVTPIVYPLSVVPARWQGLYELNPMVGIIESLRRVIVQGSPPDFHALAVSAAISVILLPIAFIYFKRVEATVADVI